MPKNKNVCYYRTAGESWVRALTPTETSLQNLNDCNTWQINLIVRFTSSRPVGEEEVHRAFKHVLRWLWVLVRTTVSQDVQT